jgi:hypothetical protein
MTMADAQGDPRDQYEQQHQQRRTATAEIMPPEQDFIMEGARSLGELAVNQDLTVVQERSLFGDLITAQPMKVHRDEAKILQKIDVWAAMASERWFYRYPVRNRKTGRTDYIEGASVKATNAVARLYGNCALDSRTMRLDEKTYICYSRFGDLETGFSITKGQLVPKSATLGGEDEERRQAIAHNIGQSKSQRNVVDAAIGDFVYRAFMGAKNSIVTRIGKNLEGSRSRLVTLLNELGQDAGIKNIVARVEYVTGRKVNEWLAPDIAGIFAEMEAIKDGFASIDEQWPLPAPAEPRRDEPQPEQPAAASPPEPAAGTAATSSTSPTPGSEPPSASVNENGAAADDPATASRADAPADRARDLAVPAGVLGQDNIIRALTDLLDSTETLAEVDEFERVNTERLSKITGQKGMQLKSAISAKRRLLGGGQ